MTFCSQLEVQVLCDVAAATKDKIKALDRLFVSGEA